MARVLGRETDCGRGRGSQGRRAPRGRAERSQGAPRYTRSSHLGPWPDPPGSCRTLGSHQAEASQVACTGRGPAAERGVCVPGPPYVLTLPQASPHACLQLFTAPWGSMARGAPGRSRSKPLWVQSHLGPRDSAGRQCEVAMAQGIVSRNVHSHSIRLLECGSRHVSDISVGGVAPMGMSLLPFLSLSEQRAALQDVRVCKCVSLCLCVCSAVCPGVHPCSGVCRHACVQLCTMCSAVCPSVYECAQGCAGVHMDTIHPTAASVSACFLGTS